VKAGAAHKKRFEDWLVEVLRDHGATDPASVARQIIVLLDGAATVMLIHRDPAYVDVAADIAAAATINAVKEEPQ